MLTTGGTTPRGKGTGRLVTSSRELIRHDSFSRLVRKQALQPSKQLQNKAQKVCYWTATLIRKIKSLSYYVSYDWSI